MVVQQKQNIWHASARAEQFCKWLALIPSVKSGHIWHNATVTQWCWLTKTVYNRSTILNSLATICDMNSDWEY